MLFRCSFACLVGALASSLVSPSLGRAQPATGTMNVERLRGSDTEAGWAGQASANVAYAQGNVNSVSVGGSGAIHFLRVFDEPVEPAPDAEPEDPCDDPETALLHARDHTFFAASGAWAKLNGGVWLSNAFVHLRHTHWFTTAFGFDAFTQFQFNDITALKRRTLVGAGMRVDAIYEREGSLSIGTGYMAEWEENEIPTDGVHPESPLNHRWTSYMTGIVHLGDGRLTIADTMYVQPRLDAFTDIRVLNEFDVQVAIDDHFSLGISVVVRHDSRPPDDVESTDLRITNSVRVAL